MKSRNSSQSSSSASSRKPFYVGIREKLLLLFIVIKVVPLVALAFLVAKQIDVLGWTVRNQSTEIVEKTRELVAEVGTLASDSSIKALDQKSRESIERLTNDTAIAIADFLYARDDDIKQAAQLPVEKEAYENFIRNKSRAVVYHKPWVLSDDGSQWLPPAQDDEDVSHVQALRKDNTKDFHYRPPRKRGKVENEPLFHEITFVDLAGKEKIKLSTTNFLAQELLDISKKENTWCKAEDYFSSLQHLQRGEIYISRVIGPYLGSPIIGPYTPERAKEKNLQFAPEQAAYAGKENPVGKRFRGIIRWATPVYKGTDKIGYVTLALNHTHLMEFTDHVVPTEERFSDISDAASGNYAFMWDYKGRNISHPRDYFIVGFDPQTGTEAIPWLSIEQYQLLQEVGGNFSEFEKSAQAFHRQSLTRKPAVELIKKGMLGLDCRYLDFAPQCTGWMNLTQDGGSGSFVIYWSKLWKLTTAATIPYYTGMYGESPRGFGFVTIGANVDEFHSAATTTAEHIAVSTEKFEQNLDEKEQETLSHIDILLKNTLNNLTVTTGVMVLIVIFIAMWIAATLTGKLTSIVQGIRRFQSGHLDTRLAVKSRDELGQLAKAFNEMSDTIEKSVKEIREAKNKAEKSDRTKSLFLANMSHEIRTPMNAIIGMSRLAVEQCEDEKQLQLLDSVKTSSESLLAIVNDILDFSKIEAGQLVLENHSFSVRSIVESVIKAFSILAHEKGNELSFAIADDVPNQVCGDSMRLRQILFNLIGNAIKFTDHGKVELTVNRGKEEDGLMTLSFQVKDNGIGIHEDDVDRIFDSFSQADLSVTRKHQGTGLGLAISKRLCQLMGGDIEVTSQAGIGSTFTFSVTLSLAQHFDSVVEKKEEHDNSIQKTERKLDILLVEDNVTNRLVAEMVLSYQGHEVASAENGIEALKMLADNSYDVILMDVQMPEMDGFTATGTLRACERGEPLPTSIELDIEEKLRQNYMGKHQPIIAMTAHAMKGDKDRCLAAGMDSYLTKPFIPEKLIEVLAEYA